MGRQEKEDTVTSHLHIYLLASLWRLARVKYCKTKFMPKSLETLLRHCDHVFVIKKNQKKSILTVQVSLQRCLSHLESPHTQSTPDLSVPTADSNSKAAPNESGSVAMEKFSKWKCVYKNWQHKAETEKRKCLLWHGTWAYCLSSTKPTSVSGTSVCFASWWWWADPCIICNESTNIFLSKQCHRKLIVWSWLLMHYSTNKPILTLAGEGQ